MWPWYLLAFAAGVGFGYVLRALVEVIPQGRTHMPKDTTAPHTTQRGPSRIQVWAMVALLTLQFLMGAMLVKTRIDAGNSADCLAAYNQAFAEAYQARNAASLQASAQLDRVISAVADKDSAEFRAAVADYVAQRDKQKAAQKATPYPPFPSEFCEGDQP